MRNVLKTAIGTGIAGILLGLGMVLFSCGSAEAADVPAEYFVWDRMPAEAPVQMKLKATGNMKLHVHPLGNAAAGQVSEGETVERISVVVRTYPAAHPVIVLRQTGTYKTDHSNKMDGPTLYPGDVVYLLMYTGEGTYLGWHNGRLVWWLSGAISEFSSNPVKNPWARYAGQLANAALDVDTWYCLRKSDGTVGWTQVQFAGKWKEEFKAL